MSSPNSHRRTASSSSSPRRPGIPAASPPVTMPPRRLPPRTPIQRVSRLESGVESADPASGTATPGNQSSPLCPSPSTCPISSNNGGVLSPLARQVFALPSLNQSDTQDSVVSQPIALHSALMSPLLPAAEVPGQVRVTFKLGTFCREFEASPDDEMERAFCYVLDRFITQINEDNRPAISRVYQNFRLIPASAQEVYERSPRSAVKTLFPQDDPASHPIIEIYEDPGIRHQASMSSIEDLSLLLGKTLESIQSQKVKKDQEYNDLRQKYDTLVKETEMDNEQIIEPISMRTMLETVLARFAKHLNLDSNRWEIQRHLRDGREQYLPRLRAAFPALSESAIDLMLNTESFTRLREYGNQGAHLSRPERLQSLITTRNIAVRYQKELQELANFTYKASPEENVTAA